MLVDCDVVSAVVVVTVMLTLASSASILSSLAFGHLYEQGQMEVGRVKLSRKK